MSLKSQFVTSSWSGVRKVVKMEAEYDEQFAVVFKAIRELMDDKTPPKKPKRKIGFV
jgi:CRISPR/Cas system-associated exonuclease Cas4 (RecB family)